MDELIADFVSETDTHLAAIDADLARLPSEGAQGESLLRIVRALHTIKGACGFLKFRRIEALAHACEGALIRWRDGRATQETLALVQTALAEIKHILSGIIETGAEDDGDDFVLLGALGAMPNALDWALELAAIRDRLLSKAGEAFNVQFTKRVTPIVPLDPHARTPLATTWATLPLLVEELGQSLGKSINLAIEGEDIEIIRSAAGPVRDALSHLIRNCADHGIETPDERLRRGKPESGVIHLTATRDGGDIVIRLRDDGRGLDTMTIRNRAISHGLVFASHAARMSAEQIHAFVFAPGFSTSDSLTKLSGRGIGLDAVRAGIEGLGGTVALHSEDGAGAVFTLTIPYAPVHVPEPMVSAALPIADVA